MSGHGDSVYDGGMLPARTRLSFAHGGLINGGLTNGESINGRYPGGGEVALRTRLGESGTAVSGGEVLPEPPKRNAVVQYILRFAFRCVGGGSVEIAEAMCRRPCALPVVRMLRSIPPRNASPTSFAGRRSATTRDYFRPQKAKSTPVDLAALPTILTTKTNPAHTKFSRCGRADRNRRSDLCAAANETGYGLRRPKGMMPSGLPTSLTRGYVRRVTYLRSFRANQIVSRSEMLHSRGA